MNARRAHAKSRNGCAQCKTRKVKCDEQIPCSRCVKRGDKCSLAAIITPLSTGGASSVTGSRTHAQDDDVFTLSDISLFHRFSTTTCRYLAGPNLPSPWLDYIPELATKHKFLMQEMMAVAALDLSINAAPTGEQVTANLELARHHHSRGLAGLRIAISSHSAELIEAIWACNTLLIPYYFASTADVSSLLFRENSTEPAEWMTVLRGAAMLYLQYEQVLLSGPMRVHIQPYKTGLRVGAVVPPKTTPSDTHVDEMTTRLQAYLESNATDSYTDARKLDTMAEVFKFLRSCFQISDRGDFLSIKSASLSFIAVIPPHFFELMGRKDQAAMVIMAFWCVLLNRAEKGTWWMQFRKVRNMLQFIADMLEPDTRALIQWPLDQLLAPED
ncbi:hypothetical protein BD289DRAFT_480637 [Coniella lustricola]|uniref:Zn(2)-C6 fungal-type domain-containing protein n=1 Tax=Coniella lustricola TaxID=2025994 RepID=A0A2T3AF45_9PEZI|nr:hypothetical protein BD289DRAFT_480637 [Coniella lustricola]